MNLLIAAATPPELAPLILHLAPYRVDGAPESYKKRDLSIRVCLTSVGSGPAGFALGQALAAYPADLAIQAGIAGCFDPSFALGEVCRVQSERFADLGAEDPDRFLDLFDLGLRDPDTPPFRGGRLPAPELPYPLWRSVPAVDAITVNTVSGLEPRIRRLREKYHPTLESMEGAVFHYACLMQSVTFAQIRSISNYVTVRDKSRWDIPMAVEKLNTFLIQWIDTL